MEEERGATPLPKVRLNDNRKRPAKKCFLVGLTFFRGGECGL